MRFITVVHPTQGAATVPESAVPHMLANGWTEPDAAVTAAVELFDPDVHTVVEVEEHLAYASVAERDRVLAAEKAGQDRPEIVGE
jgi:hypothetical protein